MLTFGRKTDPSRVKVQRRSNWGWTEAHRGGHPGESSIFGAEGHYRKTIFPSMSAPIDKPAKGQQRRVAQKLRVLGPKKSKAVMKEVKEWVKAGIVSRFVIRHGSLIRCWGYIPKASGFGFSCTVGLKPRGICERYGHHKQDRAGDDNGYSKNL
nr:hypothetical protein [Tanacetum cinerariifolium]